MRASTVFAIALALLVGLAAAAGAKYAGVFNKKETPPAPVDKPLPMKVLVAKLNLFEDITVAGEQVMVRDIRPEEQDFYQTKFGANWKDKLMPPLVTAAHQRTTKQTIQADQVLLREHFSDIQLPESVSLRLEPNTRAVNVAVQKDKAGGGVLRVGEYVDVLMTTKVSNGDKDELKTACIARACKVVMKRNSLWTVMVADPDDKPLHYTLQANPYRAALIAYAATHGELSLMPTPTPAKTTGSFADPTSKEYATEDQRVEAINRGDLTIGDKDLARIFNITPPPPKPQPQYVQHLSGVSNSSVTVYYPSATNVSPDSTPAQPGHVHPAGGTTPAAPAPGAGSSDATAGTYNFQLPSATGEAPTTGCKTCGKKAGGK